MKVANELLLVGLSFLAVGDLGSTAGEANVISASSRLSATAAGNSSVPILSGDGRHVVFVSDARNLTTNDHRSPYLNVYRYDIATTDIVLISTAQQGFRGGNDNSSAPSTSSNGDWVVFQSAARNLSSNDSNNASDIFLRNVVNGTTTLITRSTNAVWSANGASTTPLISSDGSRVVFESTASDLVAGDTNETQDIFVFNVQSGIMTRVSANSSAAGDANGASELPSISEDGRFVGFVKRATNDLGPGTSFSEIYLHDVATDSTAWASAGVFAVLTNLANPFRCSHPSVSGNGEATAFFASEVLKKTGNLFRYDRTTGNLTLVARDAATGFSPAISRDARYLAYSSGGSLFVYDHTNGSNHLASACTSGGEPLSDCHAPAFSADNSRVVFLATQSGMVSVHVYNLAADCTQLVSIATNGVAASAVPSSCPTISLDGGRVAFESMGSDLVAADYNQSVDGFVRNIANETTSVISRQARSLPAISGMRHATLTSGSTSADGSVIAFSSWDRELVADDPNAGIDLFVRNSNEGTTRRIMALNATTHAGYPSVSSDGHYIAYLQNWTNVLWANLATGVSKLVEDVGTAKPVIANISVFGPIISPNGRFVAYAKPGLGGFNVFRKDMESDPTTAVPLTVRQGSSTLLPGPWAAPLAFSPDGKWLAFVSTEWLWGGATNPVGNYQLYAHHLETGETRTVSISPDPVTSAVFSLDSRYVFFQSDSLSLSTVVARHDLLTNTPNLRLCEQCWNPSPRGDGLFAALQTLRHTGGSSATNDVYVLNLLTGESNLVSMDLSGAGGGNGNSSSPLMSYDGRYVVFTSKASNLVPNDTNNVADVFVRDLRAHTTTMVSRNIDGGPGNAPSSVPIMSADGKTVVFASFASDLVTGDFNQVRDIFTLKLGGPDTDQDGMEDEWEMAYFDSLGRDGSDDFDGDGQSDLEEFRTGTNPANELSILRVLTVTPLGGIKTLLWAAAPGRKYQVQFKDGVDGVGWTDMAGVITAAGMTGSAIDEIASSTGQRFYRVLLVQ